MVPFNYFHSLLILIFYMPPKMLLKWLKKIPPPATTTAEWPRGDEKENGTEMGEEAKQNDGARRIQGDGREEGTEQNRVEEEVVPAEDAEEDGEVARSRVSLDQLELVFPSKQTIRHLVLLNSMALPLNYGDERAPHYRLVLKNQLADEEFANDPQEHLFWTKMAYYRNSLVGAITMSRQPIGTIHDGGANAPLHFQALILTLGVIPTFRRRGVATHLMEATIQQCERWGNIQQISLHCQASNESARAFYRRHNFTEAQFIRNYYSSWRIPEPDAYRMEMVLPRRVLGEN